MLAAETRTFAFAQPVEGLKLKEIHRDAQCGLSPLSFSTTGVAVSGPVEVAVFRSVTGDWVSTLPKGTYAVKVRTSTDGRKWGKWIEAAPGKSIAAADGARFAQFQIEMRRAPDFFSFCFRELTLRFE